MAERTVSIEIGGMTGILGEMLSLTLIERTHAINQADACRRALADLPADSMEYDQNYLGAYSTSLLVGSLTDDVEAIKRILVRLEAS